MDEYARKLLADRQTILAALEAIHDKNIPVRKLREQGRVFRERGVQLTRNLRNGKGGIEPERETEARMAVVLGGLSLREAYQRSRTRRIIRR